MQPILTSPQPPSLSVPGGWAVRRLKLGPRELVYWAPANPDAFLEDAEVVAAHGPVSGNPDRSDIPFWQYVWPSAEIMARRVFAHDWGQQGKRPQAVELGAGVGVVGLAGLAAGLSVTFSDYQEPALKAAAHNAEQNGFADFKTRLLDWNAPTPERYPIILGCEVIYERAIHQPILNVLDAMLADDGVAWLADPGRSQLPLFVADAQTRGYQVEIQNAEGERLPAASSGEFQLLILQKPARDGLGNFE